MEREGQTMSEKSLMKLASDLGVSFSVAKILEDHVRAEYDAKLRAADKLCEAAKKMGYHGGDFETLTHGFLERPINVKSNDDLRKAIAGYER